MLKPYIYLVLLLFMILITYEGFKRVLKCAPIKMKVICAGVFIGVGIRYITLLVIFLLNSANYVYLTKPLYFLNLICIPIGALVTIYILIRDDRINFSYMFLISGIFIGFYVYLIYKYPIGVKVSNLYGYYMDFISAAYVYVVYMLLNVIFIILVIAYSNKKIYKIGVIFVVVSSLLLIFETMLNITGKGIFENIIISDILWILTLNYGISRLKKPGR